MTHVHSVPVDTQPEPCETVSRRPAAPLRPYVVGYGGFRTGSGAALPHRVLPLNITVAIVDLTGEARVVTGPRATPAVFHDPVWRGGVTVGFTPLGVRALLGVPAPDLVGRTVPLPDLIGRADTELVDRLGAVTHWADRFAVLDALLSRRLAPVEVDPLVTRAWWQLQGDRVRVGALARQLAVSRRRLELGFRREIGVAPGTVGRIARFQHAVGLLAQGAARSAAHSAAHSAALPRAAVDSGYADQPHFTREIRTMSGLTPTELCAFLQYRGPVPH